MANGAVTSDGNHVLIEADLANEATVYVSVADDGRDRWGFPCESYNVGITKDGNEFGDVNTLSAKIDNEDARRIAALFLQRAETVAGVLTMAHRVAVARGIPGELCDALAVRIDRFAEAEPTNAGVE
jgi:hypothetical protein